MGVVRRGLLASLVGGLGLAAAAFAAPPSNDNRVDATPLDLPASVRGSTVDATEQESEPSGSCASVRGTVWYSIAAGAKRRVAVRLAAGGDLDAVIEVFRRQRSQLDPERCEPTDRDGEAAFTFTAREDERYLIRVARRTNSEPGRFALDVFEPRPPARPPGRPLPRKGVTRSVDRLENTDDAFRMRLRPGVSYRVNLAPRGGRCIGLTLFGPGTKSFSGGGLRSLRCGGYLLFTPGPGGGGRHSLLVESNDNSRGAQRYRLDVARAGPDDSLPGIRVGRRAQGRVRGGGIDVVDLYRFDVLRRANVDLRLATQGGADLDLQLRRQSGKLLECSCGASGLESISRRLRRGRFYLAVSASPGEAGRYRLRRVVRTITTTVVRFNGRRKAGSEPGETVALSARIGPGVSGPVTIVVERKDPLSGFQFHRRYRTRARDGVAVVAFRPSAAGRYRASAAFRGTRTAAPSESPKPAGLLVSEPLQR